MTHKRIPVKWGTQIKKTPDMHKREREKKNYVVGILILYSQMGGGVEQYF